MILTKLVETIIRTPSGGIMTDENKLDRDFIAANIHQASATAKIKWYETKGSIHDMWFQRYIPPYETPLQTTGDCMAQFRCPQTINLGTCRDGFEYVGTPDGRKAFPWLGPGGMETVYANHPVSNRRGRVTWRWEYNEGGYGVIKLYGRKNLSSILVKGIFANPLDIPTFRQEFDQYPITEELIPLIRQELCNLQTKIIVMQRADTVSDSQSTAQP